MSTIPRTALLLALALLLPTAAFARSHHGRERRVQADIDVEPLPSLLAVASPAGARCRVLPRGGAPYDGVAPFEMPVSPGPAVVDCFLPSGRVHRAEVQVRAAQRVTIRLADRGPGRPPCPPGGCVGAPLSPPEFAGLVRAMGREPYTDARLGLLERTADSAWFMVGQAGQLIDLFARSADRVQVVELVAPHLVDRENGYHLLDRFPYAADRARVRWILESWSGDRVSRR
jgi:hypothetical protein